MLNPLQSDHSPIKIKFKSLNAMKGKGYWKFNNSLLDDNTFVQNMKSKINETIPSKGMRKMMCGYKIKAMHKGCIRECVR